MRTEDDEVASPIQNLIIAESLTPETGGQLAVENSTTRNAITALLALLFVSAGFVIYFIGRTILARQNRS